MDLLLFPAESTQVSIIAKGEITIYLARRHGQVVEFTVDRLVSPSPELLTVVAKVIQEVPPSTPPFLPGGVVLLMRTSGGIDLRYDSKGAIAAAHLIKKLRGLRSENGPLLIDVAQVPMQLRRYLVVPP